ncbi:nucleotidyltransferase-like protein [Salibacterium aidingense]|uniref:nucleotidyltransferase-like protein n=1 Tax=Salibacterium aidingense TaxID=384933 RepID=UPI003BED7461
MEKVLRQICREYAEDADTQGIVLVEKAAGKESLTDFFDAVLLVISAGKSNSVTHHFNGETVDISLHVVAEEDLFEWIITGKNRKIMEWLLIGELLYNRNNTVPFMKKRLKRFPGSERRKRSAVEFAGLVRSFEDGKTQYHLRHFLDAFHDMFDALDHLARLSVIEKGMYPEVTIWEQVKEIDPETYKLYQELVAGEDNVEKRLELLIIAVEFSIRSKSETGKAHLETVLKVSGRQWSYDELCCHPELEEYAVDLEILLQYLVKHGYINKEKKHSKLRDIFYYKYG